MVIVRHIDFEVPGWGEFVSGPVVWQLPVFADDFNRADEVLDASANWVKWIQNPAYGAQVSGQQLAGPYSWRGVYRWAVEPAGSDQFAEADQYAYQRGLPMVRVPSGAQGGYGVLHYGVNQFRMYRANADWSWTVLSITSVANPTTPYTLRVEAEGSSIRGYLNSTLIASVTDSVWTGGGVGVGNYGNYCLLDNWRGGDL